MRTGMLGACTLLLIGSAMTRAQSHLPAPDPNVQFSAADGETETGAFDTPASGSEGAGCGDKGCCGRPGIFWASAEYLLWWTKDAEVPAPLLTVGQGASDGTLGQPGTTIRYGLNNLDYDVVSGCRVAAGITNSCQTLGLMGSGFFLQDQTDDRTFFSNALGVPVLARPIIDANLLQETVLQVASPNAFAGGFFVDASSRFWGAEANGVIKIASGDGVSLDLLLGYNHLDLDENFQVGQVTNLLPGSATGFNGQLIQAPASVEIRDGFETRNQFNGAQLGTLFEINLGRFYCYAIGKVALGSTQQTLLINGQTALFQPGAQPVVAPGGLLAVASNIGHYERNEFTVVPQTEINLGYQVFPWLRAYVGYTFLYWSTVVRPSQQIDRIVNINEVPVSTTFNPVLGPLRPLPPFDQSNFWAQGIQFGLAMRF